jgi:SAM-dependent methyltransferase
MKSPSDAREISRVDAASSPKEAKEGHRYGDDFFKDLMEGSLQSAREVVPLIISLVRPASVVDVGCGIGTWLSVFLERSIQDVVGVDGSYVNQAMLLIPQANFVGVDLAKGFSLARRFDLAISLEVAEHLPESSAKRFVEDLTRLSDVVAFSAAVPGQGGTHHINEQWPSYWERLFKLHGYLLVDCFRRLVWDNENVGPCYRQNLFLYVKEDLLSSNSRLREEAARPRTFPLCAVHPGVLQHALSRPPTLRPILRSFPRAVGLAVAKRWALLWRRDG